MKITFNWLPVEYRIDFFLKKLQGSVVVLEIGLLLGLVLVSGWTDLGYLGVFYNTTTWSFWNYLLLPYSFHFLSASDLLTNHCLHVLSLL